MFVIMLALGILVVIGLTMLVSAAISAPFGEEDRNGFHFDSPADQEKAVYAPADISAADLQFFSR
jgi:hypothetical protein